MNKKLLVTLTVFTSLMFTSCSSNSKESSQPTKDSITLMQNGELQSLDVSEHADLITWNMLENTMEGLYKSGKNHQPEPAIATKVVQPTDNATVYTFPLRKDALWSNGDPVTAQDFVAAWRRSVSPTAKSGYNYIFSGIENADAITTGQKKVEELGVKALDSHTLQVKLEHPMPYFNKMMVMPAFFPESQAALKKFGSKYGTSSDNLYYNGAFKLTGWSGSNESWTLKQNPHYYDQKSIKLKSIKYLVVKDSTTAHELFEQNKLDEATVTGVTAKELQKDPKLVRQNRAGNYYLRVNLADGHPLSNKKMRQALSLVIDRKSLTKNVLADGSVPAYTYVAKDLTDDPTTEKDFASAHTPKKTYDVKAAQKLWEEGRKEAGLNQKVKLTAVGDDQTVTKNILEFIQSSVQKNLTDVEVTMRNIPAKSASEEVHSGKFDLSKTLWLADFADPISFMTILTKDNPQNYGKYNDSYYDELYKKASTSDLNNQAKYWKLLNDLEERLNETMPVIPLYQMVESHLVNPNLKGVLRHPVGENDYTRAYLK
ncbi:peptide ABC transporter substrate-binding protein [Xylocopilactobacillus apicola]|uniref:Peptide ABC transporter substrate-binding protein n=1 Tax=Xylocopilactobacillus apicola TaxID=2932184 RepID=A0AAU9DF67_9LACO|nr:peptide ABC transporter substrate-binding protein [Xylocopilactobacillus apicola]BDR59567.1 peptide ABC transporter substrate-binding protein [Xylocopilactobacillus apicola]